MPGRVEWLSGALRPLTGSTIVPLTRPADTLASRPSAFPSMTPRTNRLSFAAFLLAGALAVGVGPLRAEDKPFKPSEAKTSKPDLLGRTRTELRDAQGRKVGEAVTTRPNLIGDSRTVVRDASGRKLGEAVTRKPDALGKSRTTFKDPSGSTLGQGVTTKPDLMGRSKTRFTDPSGRMLGEAVTTKPDLMGQTRTTIRGGTPWNPSSTSGSGTTPPPATRKP